MLILLLQWLLLVLLIHWEVIQIICPSLRLSWLRPISKREKGTNKSINQPEKFLQIKELKIIEYKCERKKSNLKE